MSQNWLSSMPESEFKSWYKAQIKAEAIKHGLKGDIPTAGKQSRLRHDYWSLYDYGDVIKVVYIKSAPSLPTPEREPFFPDERKVKKPTFQKFEKPDDERFKNSVSRSKARIFELAMCNEFTHFCTFTQDESMRDRFDLKTFRKDFAQLVRNINRNRPEGGKIKYLLIPEQHKNGAWHMHGLLMGLTPEDLRPFNLSEKLPYRIREQIENGETVYDWSRYRRAFGYFTCTEIKNHTACSKYITKYISKDLQKTVREGGEHLFFASQGLNGRETIVKNCFDSCPISQWDYENDFVKVVEIKKEVSEKTESEN